MGRPTNLAIANDQTQEQRGATAMLGSKTAKIPARDYRRSTSALQSARNPAIQPPQSRPATERQVARGVLWDFGNIPVSAPRETNTAQQQNEFVAALQFPENAPARVRHFDEPAWTASNSLWYFDGERPDGQNPTEATLAVPT